MRGDLANATKLLERSTAHASQLDNLLRAELLDGVATARDLVGQHAEAEQTLREALALREALGHDHPAIATSMSHLATLAWSQGRPDDALPLFDRMLALQEEEIARLLVWGDEASKRDALARVADRVDWLVSYDLARTDDRATRLALNAIASRQGRALDAAAASHGVLFADAPPAASKLFAELRRTNERIVWLTFRGGSGSQHDLATLRATAQQLGDQLGRELPVLDRSAVRGLTGGVATLARALGPGQALVDYVMYRPFHPERVTNRYDAAHYAAYVVLPEGRVSRVDLGPASRIDDVIGTWRTALASRGDDDALARELHALVVAPVTRMLGGARDLVVVPDANLNLVPFEALLGDARLLATHRFTVLSSARDLVTSPTAHGEGVVLFANPEFGPTSRSTTSTGLLDGIEFTPLPSTVDEASGIARAFPALVLHVGREATGAAFKEVRQPRILHVATHGFFIGAEDVRGTASTRGLVRVSREPVPPPVEVSALLRSGLAFAFANTRGPNTVVAGLELADIDLRGTQLVTLSACETGVGEAAAGDGVHGIRRALRLAGSETQVLSLWKVDDAVTARLMTGFYDRLHRGASRADALRDAKQELAASPDFAHPYFWAAFVLSGSPNKLDGARPDPLPVPSAVASVARGPRGCGCRTGDSGGLILVLLALRWVRRGSHARSLS